MHADLVKLLDLQAKDAVVADVERRLDALQGEFTTLDQALDKARAGLETARRTAADAGRRRDELEAKIESYRLLQDRRRLRLEHVRNPKEASTLMAELDLARSVVAKEENDWIRSAETVTQLERKASEEERNVALVEEGQAVDAGDDRAEGEGGGVGGRAGRRQRRPGADGGAARPPAPHPLRAAQEVSADRGRGAAHLERVRGVSHGRATQPAEPDPQRGRDRRVRGLRRHPVPAGRGAVRGMNRFIGRLPW